MWQWLWQLDDRWGRHTAIFHKYIYMYIYIQPAVRGVIPIAHSVYLYLSDSITVHKHKYFTSLFSNENLCFCIKICQPDSLGLHLACLLSYEHEKRCLKISLPSLLNDISFYNRLRRKLRSGLHTLTWLHSSFYAMAVSIKHVDEFMIFAN